MIDSRNVAQPEDVQSDLNGVFANCKEIKTFTIEIKSDDKRNEIVHVISKKKLELQEGQMHLRVHRVENEFGLIRNIFYFVESNGNIFNDCIILQYFLDRNICGNATEAKFKVASHGNSSSSNDGRANAFYPLKKSTISNIKQGISGSGKKKTQHNV